MTTGATLYVAVTSEEPQERGGESVNRSELHNTPGASYPERLHNEGDRGKVSVGHGVL